MPNYTYHVQVQAVTMRQVELESDAPLSDTEINQQGIEAFKKEYGSDFEDIEVFERSRVP